MLLKKLQGYQNVQNFKPNNVDFTQNYDNSNRSVTKCNKPDNGFKVYFTFK